MKRRAVLSAIGVSLAGCLRTSEPALPEGVALETVTDGLRQPWGLAFDPEGRLLVTELEGRLSLVDPADRSREELVGVPEVHTAGQGGLLDVAVGPDGEWLYLTYATANDDGESTTAVGRGRLDIEGGRLESFEELYTAEPFVDSNAHYGSRVVVGPDERLYVTVGDRQFTAFDADHVSQDRTTELGTTRRLETDGSIPADNPFVDGDGSDAIYSYGHRNSQGMAVHPETGELWQSEHGEEDGDELNIVERGGNYGWPVAHTGCEYGTDEPVGDHPHDREEVVDPVHSWECGSGGFPPAGITFYDGPAFQQWQGDLFVGNLAGEYLGHFVVSSGSKGGDSRGTRPAA